jgi:hypothetical protein
VGEVPWFKFYPSDWRADQALRICSAAARGLWIECMCLMHEAKPYGHLLVNGRAVSEAQLANLTGIPQSELMALLMELESAGVFSRDGAGVIYSRRMARDARRAADGKMFGKRGGNPALVDKGADTGRDNGEVKGVGSPRVQNPDSESPSKDLLKDVVSVLSPVRHRKLWTPAQKKAAWQSKICNEAQRTMPEAAYAQWVTAWAAGDAKAADIAERIDRRMKARASRAG